MATRAHFVITGQQTKRNKESGKERRKKHENKRREKKKRERIKRMICKRSFNDELFLGEIEEQLGCNTQRKEQARTKGGGKENRIADQEQSLQKRKEKERGEERKTKP